VLEAGHAPAAMEVGRRNRSRIDLVITDMVMPEGVNGMELSIRMRLENPGLKVIYSSGYSPETAGQNLTLDDGMYFLQKPYGLETLAKVVRDCLDEREPIRN
jgi:DNA-binding NtrC family response regulator